MTGDRALLRSAVMCVLTFATMAVAGCNSDDTSPAAGPSTTARPNPDKVNYDLLLEVQDQISPDLRQHYSDLFNDDGALKSWQVIRQDDGLELESMATALANEMCNTVVQCRKEKFGYLYLVTPAERPR